MAVFRRLGQVDKGGQRAILPLSLSRTGAGEMAELGLAILIVGILLFTDHDRLEWLVGKLRDFIDWVVTE